MSDIGRAYLTQVFNSSPYKTWAVQPANKTDASKVARKFAGTNTPKPGSGYAKGLWGLCALNPPSGTPVPPTPPATAVAAVWKLDAAFSNGGLSNFAGAARDRALQLGWSAVYVQLMHISDQQIQANIAEMARSNWNAWTKVGWSTYGQGTDPEQDGAAAAALCKQLPALKGWKANGEAWAEAQYAWKTSAFLKGWVAGGAPVPLGWSVLSSDTAGFAREYDYPTALSVAGADIDIQVYGATVPTYTVGAGLGMLAKANVPVSRTTMSFDVTDTGVGPFPDYRTWAGPRRLWNCGNATVATFDALAR
jgi:hypothetical protein